MWIQMGAWRAHRVVLSMILAIGISAAACATGATSPDAPTSSTPTGSATLEGSSAPISAPTPAPSPTAASLLPMTGTWAGDVLVPGDPRTRITLSLHDCAPGQECGSIELRQNNGVGCPYLVERFDADTGAFPSVALQPLADERIYYVINAGGIDCEESWLVDAVLFIRPTTGGSILVSRVQDLLRDPTFTLDPAAAPAPYQEPSATADQSTLVPGRNVTITIAGFAADSVVFIGLEPDSGPAVALGRVAVDGRGAAIVVVMLPVSAVAGRATIWVEGSDRDSRETGVPIAVTVVPR